MTNREFYTKVVEAGIDEEMTNYANAAIKKLDIENEKRRAKTLEKAKEIAPILERIYNEILTEDPITASEVSNFLENYSVQKTTFFLKTLCSQEKAIQTEISLKGKGKVKAYAKIW